jgi:hypothetical protein
MEKKTEDGEKIVSLATWEMVCNPKDNGGLGVLNMKIQSPSMLLKYLDKFYNRKDLQTCLCCSFWWKSIYRGIASCSIGQGTQELFWKDNWNKSIMHETIPCLFSYSQNGGISVVSLQEQVGEKE